jgi:hypothetical protein
MNLRQDRCASLWPVLAFIDEMTTLQTMQKVILTTNLTVALAAPASAATYSVSGRWGQSASSAKGAIEYHSRRVITF